MDFEKQSPAAALIHPKALRAGITCIECHKGIGHGKVEDAARN